ncbi:GtrA family protein [Diaphorobacter caeni]|uniref:GtrA family protein n=1 Tax=Diaphorobacter caeni TaxID=2784387 RepID=UPI00389921AC
MYYLKWSPVLSNLTGYIFGLVLGYILNKNWTFKSKESSYSEMLRYAVVIVTSYIANVGLVYLSTTHLQLSPYLAQPLGMVTYTGLTFIGCKIFVFKSSKNIIYE